MKPTLTVAVSLTLAAMILPSMPTARADPFTPQFASPSGNIDCYMGSLDGKAFADCEIRDHTFAAPPRPTPCMGGFGNRISIRQGSPPEMTCHTDSVMGTGYPTLQYGHTQSQGPITCDSETAGMTCTDNSTGHFFRLSSDSYELR
jgi:hypothetical protein